MSQLPQIVRERLKASAPPGAHPDADVLTAFSEHALPANERAVVTEHLARCGDCREILALALPASESAHADELHTVRPRRTWLSWPVMRRGFAVAAIAIVAGVGVVQYQRHARPTQMAYFKKAASGEAVQPSPVTASRAEVKVSSPPSQADANPEPSQKTPPLTTTSALHDPARSSPQIPGRSQPADAAEAPGITTGSAGRLSARELGANVTMNVAPNEATAASPAPRAYPAAVVPQPTPSNNVAQQALAQQQMTEKVEVQSQATTVTTQDQDQARDSTQKQLDLPRAQQQRASNDPIYFHAEGDKEMSRAKAPVPQTPENVPAGYSIGGPLPVGMSGRSSLPLAAPTWNISSTGRLQRSLDGGKAWEDVDVSNLRLITSETMLSVGSPAKDSRAPEAGKENKKEKTDLAARKTPASSPQTFRAVSANAFDVWAGGSGGALYHSVDGGNQWTRVFPTVNSVVLTGDIVSIQFSDPEHGTLTTAVAEVWTTTDAGHSWQRH